MTEYPILSLLVFLPAAGALALLPLWGRHRAVRGTALAVALAELALAASLLPAAQQAPATFFIRENLEWIPRFGIRYLLGIDGISFPLVLLTGFITVVAVSASWRGVREKVELHYLLLLVMESGIVGVFLSLDLFLFYLFWEVMLIPMFLLIGIWGHGRRVYSAVKFFVYTMGGSLLMLLAILALYLLHGAQGGGYTFSVQDLAGTPLSPALSALLFAAFLLAFAIKFPLFPLHTWLPDAHTDAPTAGSIILAALLLKTGAYGLIRFGYPLFPGGARTLTPLLVVLAVTGIIYASWIAFAQTDMKRLVAYSSVGHMGFVALGVAAWTPVALSGAVMQMVNHGVTTAALFAMVGMLDERMHTRELERYGGVWGEAPVLASFFLLFAMASAGLPGLNNFTGEILVLTGSFRTLPVAAMTAAAGILLPLVYTTRLVQELLYAEPRGELRLAELSLREGVTLAALAAAVLYLGLHPSPLLAIIRPAIALLFSGGMP
ncbi:MAG TPA: NADH-quinone oxidoreductase subunit M [Verrucomicrobiae bacterium]|nr:NADH-quinone oxidoreductase subunit M [Verrucomicrobiae bacterium]